MKLAGAIIERSIVLSRISPDSHSFPPEKLFMCIFIDKMLPTPSIPDILFFSTCTALLPVLSLAGRGTEHDGLRVG